MNIENIKNFIENSAKQFGMSKDAYLENVAKTNYVVVESNGEAIAWDENNIMVLKNVSLATEEAAGTMDKIMREYDYYKMKKAI